MKYKGIIFDLDGVLCSTDRFHFEAWKQTAEEVGAPFDETINMKLRGVSRMESLEIILSGSREYGFGYFFRHYFQIARRCSPCKCEAVGDSR